MKDAVTNYIIASDLSGRWLVIDIRGGFECRIMCETDSRGKAAWISGLFNKYGDDRGAPSSWTGNGKNSKSHSVPVLDQEAEAAQAETDQAAQDGSVR